MNPMKPRNLITAWTRHLPCRPQRGLLALALLAAISFVPAVAGPADMKDMKEITPALAPARDWEPGDPLGFADGIGTFDVQIRERFQKSDNWLDFNSNNNARDDAGLLERLRLGLKLKPVDGFTFYAQMEDSRTFFDDSNTFKPHVGSFVANSQ